MFTVSSTRLLCAESVRRRTTSVPWTQRISAVALSVAIRVVWLVPAERQGRGGGGPVVGTQKHGSQLTVGVSTEWTTYSYVTPVA